MTKASLARAAKRDETTIVGIYDFSYAPYALGDALTWQMNLAVLAEEHGCDRIEQCVVIEPSRPANRHQPFVTMHNYMTVFDGLFPAFLCSPKLQSIKVFRHPPSFNLFVLREAWRRRPMWPSFWSHLRRKMDYVSHKRINAFYASRRYLPWLTAPRGYGPWADAWLRKHCGGRFVVAVNIRQSALSHNPANLFRDSPMPEWIAFMRRAAGERPETVFLVLGGFTEWPRALYSLPNVCIPRAMGFGLGHELALLHRADLFMGSSSGFATMATFSNKPYFITKVEHLFSPYIDVPVGGRHHPFGGENQILHWETETQDLLLERFRELSERIQSRRVPA